ncbi:nitrilase-related carbon-nitrogen hydrolase [Sporolactobacillus kofuensis]|uniref:Nitrilase-related carbon-nitrogen hydrolase n=1 Tax=Sporolactobacillus kofuensis TaxID=269672 RepID=A0ABW1WDS2_9BACL|nr:nitrilase-related carbon-nitrogen hydrolase [Sporolactobacillus kofuensis]MCO7174760.1 nitrilase [Sporolactobacillus kofuensis]
MNMIHRKSIILSVSLIVIIALSFFAFSFGENTNTEAKSNTQKLKSFKVASIEFNPKLNDRDKNIDALYKQIETAFKHGAKLAVAPEMSTTGYYYKNREAIKPFVDTIPGKATKKFAKLTRKYHAYVVFGMAEKDPKTNVYYDSSALVGPGGYIGKYRKTEQWETEEHWAAWGDLGVPVFKTELGNIAINICMDAAYPEMARLAAVNGADIMAFPTNSSAQAVAALPARAMENGLYIVSANRSNTEKGFHMIGASAVWSPTGKKLAEAKLIKTPKDDINKPTITYATIDPKQYNNANKKRLKERRPDLYQDIMLKVGPWDYTTTSEPKSVNALAIQYTPVPGNKKSNEDKIVNLIDSKIKNSEVRPNLIVLPELSLTGPSELLKLHRMSTYAERIDGETTKFMKTLAQKYQTAIVYGLIEKSGKNLYNTAVLMDKSGKIDGKYRQAQLSSFDKKWAKRGNSLPVFSNNELGKVGIMIGNDVNFPEISSVFAVQRADIIAIPSSWYGQFGGNMEINHEMSANPYPSGTMPLWSEISIDAQSYTIISNYVGTSKGFKGRSALYTLDPLYGLDQPIVASSNKEEALAVKFKTIQPNNWFNQDKLINSRQPAYYKPLIK